MVFVLLGLAVFMGAKIAQEAIEYRSAYAKLAWYVLLVGSSALGLWAAGENPGWCLAVVAIAGFAYRLDAILGAARDWIRVQVLRGPPRR